jgi:type II secretory pathway pseudopilin PulG
LAVDSNRRCNRRRNIAMGNFAIPKHILLGIAFLGIASSVQAAPRHASAREEREQTRNLNEQQLEQVRQQNAGLVINAHSTAIDAAATAADNSPPAAAPTTPVQSANNLPQIAPVPAAP